MSLKAHNFSIEKDEPNLTRSIFKDLSQRPDLIADEHIKDGILLQADTTQDLIAKGAEFALLESINKKLLEARRIVGYGNYNLLGFNECANLLKNSSKLGAFTSAELDKIEELFTQGASVYGFFGQKVLLDLRYEFNKKDLIKIPHTGHYLFKGKSLYLYDKITKQVGTSIILTSGVRGIVKQLQLFLSKVMYTKGNMSLASRSLAPPGYSYHGIGDFDVGKVGFGYKNFTQSFEKTTEYKRLMDLGYVSIRYTKDNPFGVRYEPWHIKVGV